MRNPILIGVVLAGTMAGAQAAVVAPAAAAVTAPAESSSVAAGCSKRQVLAEAKLTIRKTANAGSASNGSFPKGKRADCLGNYAGGKVTACGKTGTTWTHIAYGSKKGYVPFSCVKSVDPS